VTNVVIADSGMWLNAQCLQPPVKPLGMLFDPKLHNLLSTEFRPIVEVAIPILDHVRGSVAELTRHGIQCAAQCESGNVKVLKGDWNTAFLDELCSFPYSRNDDQVDAASGAFTKLAIRSVRRLGTYHV